MGEKKETEIQTVSQLWYLKDGNRYRVWREKWPSDTFEVLSSAEFEQLSAMCRRFGLILEESE